MIQINFKNVLEINPEQGVTNEQFESRNKVIPFLLQKIQDRRQGFYEVINDEKFVKQIEDFYKKTKKKFSDIVLLGIGGSALGAKAIRDALCKTKTPRLHIVDNIDPDVLEKIEKKISLAKTLFLVISKSGGTVETLSQYFYFREKLKKENLEFKNHCVFVTESRGFLYDTAQQENIETFEVPENVGGRFSVLTNVGLLPASLINIDIKKILKGSQNMRESFLSLEFEKNMPFQLANIIFELNQKGKNKIVLMPYISSLRTFAEWHTQLLAESTGKFDALGANVGLTPIAAQGSTDQHSLLQLLMQGPNDTCTLFIRTEKFKNDALIPLEEINEEKFGFLKKISFGQLINTEQTATADALRESNRPNITITIPKVDEETLGQLFLLFECATAFLGELMNINCFDQPGVERGKILTKEYLSK